MNAHTTGLWSVVRENSVAAANGYIAKITVQGSADNEGRANARLIAAAPLMLEALKAFVTAEEDFIQNTQLERKLPKSDFNDWLTDAYKQAVAAIRKATGKEAPQ